MRFLLVIVLIAATTWLAVDIYLGAAAAPCVFAHAPPHADALITRAQAGALFGDLLGGWMAIVDTSLWPLLMLSLCILAGYALRGRRPVVAGLCLVAVLSLIVVHQWSRSTVASATAIRPPVKEADEAAYGEDKREAFDALHRRSVTLFGIECLLLLGVVIGVASALAGRRDPLGSSASEPGR